LKGAATLKWRGFALLLFNDGGGDSVALLSFDDETSSVGVVKVSSVISDEIYE
jgi:hypothetical protein